MSVLAVAGVVSLVLVLVGATAAAVRLVRGPGTPDRAVAADVLVAMLMAGLLVGVTLSGSGVSIPALLVLSLLGFISSATLARYLPRGVDGSGGPRGGDEAERGEGPDGVGGTDGAGRVDGADGDRADGEVGVDGRAGVARDGRAGATDGGGAS